MKKKSSKALVARGRRKLQQIAAFFRKLWRIKKVRIACFVLAGLVLLVEVAPLISRYFQAANYDLGAARTLVNPTSKELRKKLDFDDKRQAWMFNSNAQEQLPGQSGQGIKVGGLTYSAELPKNLSKSAGLKMTDEAAKIDMTMTPQFSLGEGRVQEGYAVYPIKGSDAQLVYTFKQDGVKEDIILHRAPGDKTSFAYTLDLPDSLEARLQDDGSVGIFGGDRSLFGNISYGSDKDKELVEKARKNSKKTQLYYAIPAPVIRGEKTDSVKAQFRLNGDKLTVEVSGLKDTNYPLSIDPSFVMDTSANCSWQKAGNNEGNLSYAGCQLTRSGLNGGTAGTWNTTSAMVTDYYSTETVAASGYIYILGGRIDSGGANQGVQYAAINANGTIGALHYTHNSIDDNTTYVSGYNAAHENDFRAFAYNGYLYVVGGSSGSSVTSTIDRAPLNANGTVGTWSVLANQMNTSRADFGLEVYNGYMYAFAGCTSINVAVACNGYSNTLEYAKINGDGTVGTWTLSGNNLTSTRIDTTSAVYNGYLYAFGGCVSNSGGLDNCSGGSLSSVEYAAIDSSTGAVGTWSVVNSFTTARRSMNVASHNGYMYLFGGASGATIYSDVQMAKIYANGSLGQWRTTTALAGVRKDMGVTTYNGYIYTAGGCSAAGTNCGGSGGIAEVRYSQITTTLGDVSPFATETDVMPTTNGGIHSAATVIYGGYMYILGGRDKDSNTNAVRYAQLNADGSTGAWATTSAFTDARTELGATAYNGYIYIAGGHRTGGTTDCPDPGIGVDYCTDIQYAQINSDGTLGAWASAGGPYAGAGNTGRSALDMVVYDGYVYVMGGNYNNNSDVSPEVDVAPVNANGTVGTWTQNATALGTGRAHFQLAQSGQYVYMTGGRKAPGGFDNADVVYATLSSGGGMSAWASAGPDFTAGRTDTVTAAANGYLYIAGGSNNGATKDVQYIKINTTTGALSGSWTTSAIQFNLRRINHQGGIYNGNLYLVGGCQSMTITVCNNPIDNIEYADIYNGGGGSTNNWTTQGVTDSSARMQLAAAAYNDYVYIAGGCGGNLGAGPMGCTNLGMIGEIRYAAMGGDGTIGSWASAGADFSPARTGLVTVPSNGYMYVMGGCSAGSSGNCTTFQNDVQYALICTGNNNGVGGCGSTPGTVGTWNATTSFSTGRYGLSGVASNGYMYVMGGCSATAGGSCTTFQNDVQYALICTGNNNGVGGCGSTPGTVGTWSSAGSAFATGRLYQTATINNSYLYVMGGCSAMSGVACTTYQSDIQHRQINVSNGTLTGSWTVAPSFGGGRFGAVAVAHNGYLYLTGGCTAMSGGNCSQTLDTTSYLPLFANGTTGSWSVTAGRLAAPRALHGAVVSKGHLIIFNGVQQNNSFVSTASTAGLMSTPAIARHSMLLKTDARTLPANFFTTVAPQSGSSSINVGASTANDPAVILNNLGTSRQITSVTKYQLTPGNDGTKYYWLHMTLDDSRSMTFEETAGSSMSYLQLNYHPNPGMRLRGGKTFNNNIQQSLDAY